MGINILLIVKYALAIAIVWCIVMAPAYLARQTSKKKYDMMRVRVSSWLFGWTGIGWLIALIFGVRK